MWSLVTAEQFEGKHKGILKFIIKDDQNYLIIKIIILIFLIKIKIHKSMFRITVVEASQN